MSQLRILVTGSRTWSDKAAVWNTLDEIMKKHPGWRIIIVHGDCPRGADRFAREWVKDLEYAGGTVVEERYPADWRRGRSAGFRRNEIMVRLGADMCLTFIDPCKDEGCSRLEIHGSHGAVHCATAASKAGIPVRHCAPVVQWTLPIDPIAFDVQLKMGE